MSISYQLENLLGSLRSTFLKEQIKKSFGNDSIGKFPARVLKVEELNPNKSIPGIPDDVSYRMKCRVMMDLAPPDKKEDSRIGVAAKGHKSAIGWLPDPCNYAGAKANKIILSHPWYIPDNNKSLQKPSEGDIIMVQRDLTNQYASNEVAGTFVGFLIPSPPRDLPKPSSKNSFKYRGGNNRKSKKVKPFNSTPPKKYSSTELQKVAADVIKAINGASLAQSANKEGVSTYALADYDTGLSPYDSRLSILVPISPFGEKYSSTEYKQSIPTTWATSGPEFSAINKFIMDNTGGYPGMPNAAMRKSLVNGAIDREVLKGPKKDLPPSIEEFATKEDYWKLWWEKANPNNISQFLFENYQNQINSGPWNDLITLRAGFPMCVFPDGIDRYFPTSKVFALGIEYEGVQGIGDPFSEMYALLMFIKINFGSPTQMQSMIEARNRVEGFNRHSTFDESRRQSALAGLIGYEIDYTIMPTISQFANGMINKFPPEGEG